MGRFTEEAISKIFREKHLSDSEKIQILDRFLEQNIFISDCHTTTNLTGIKGKKCIGLILNYPQNEKLVLVLFGDVLEDGLTFRPDDKLLDVLFNSRYELNAILSLWDLTLEKVLERTSLSCLALFDCQCHEFVSLKK